MARKKLHVTQDQRRLLALCAIQWYYRGVDWSLIAREASFPDGLDTLWSGHILENSRVAETSRDMLRYGIRHSDELFKRVDIELEAAELVGATLVTVLDDDYPINLRLIPNLPPFLFVRGEIRKEDALSVAVIGSRNALRLRVLRAERMSELLVDRGVTVVSGLARGIDTAAHSGAIGVGGRTIAVLGTGITRCYPKENRQLANDIACHGALVSQFWPLSPPGRDTFPRRNVVTSGISQGTVVIEASRKSGAKMQARIALEHGKKVFLLSSLVESQEWAQIYVEEHGAIEINSVDDVTKHLAPSDRLQKVVEQRQQLIPAFL